MNDLSWGPPPSAAGRRRTSPWLIVAVVVAVLVAGAGIFGRQIVQALGEDRLTGTCGVVVDRSGSSGETNGFDAGRQIETALPRFLTKIKCRHVVFGPIDANSQTSPCVAQPLDIDPDTRSADRQQLWINGRQKAKARANEILTCKARKGTARAGSDVLGGLSRMLDQRPLGDERFTMLVISDFINNDTLVLGPGPRQTDISTPKARDRVLANLTTVGRVPNLSGVDVYAAGFGISLKGRADQFQPFDAFWRELMGRAQCQKFQTQVP
jgi:hypothetical protein